MTRKYKCWNCKKEIPEREANIVDREINLMDFEDYEVLIDKLSMIHCEGSNDEFFEHGGAVLCKDCAKKGGVKTL